MRRSALFNLLSVGFLSLVSITIAGCCCCCGDTSGINLPSPAELPPEIQLIVDELEADDHYVTVENGKVTGIDIGSKDKTPALLEKLPKLSTLVSLTMNDMNLNDEDLDHIQSLTNLEMLELYGNNLTGASLDRLNGMQRLSHLDLDGNPITDESMVHVSNLSNLATLYLNSTEVTDAGIAKLQNHA